VSSIVKLGPTFKHLGVTPQDRELIRPTKDNLGALIPASVTLLSSGEEGKTLEDTVKMNQIIKMIPAINLNTTRYTILVGYNPKLAEVGAVSVSSILPPGEEISLVLKAFKNFSLDEFTERYAFIIYAID